MKPTIVRNTKTVTAQPKINMRYLTFTRLGKYGRLGNQMFQIAAVLCAAKKQGIPARFPKWYCNYDNICYSDYFKNKIDQSLRTEDVVNTYREPEFQYSPIPAFPTTTDLYGYFQSDRYFEEFTDVVKHHFQPTDALIQKIESKYKNELEGETCSVHIRRGDYVGSKVHDTCGIDYYRQCINEMKSNGVNKFLIFSDDINWCKTTFTGGEYFFIEGNNPIEDMFIMACCKHNIISNSSFSWWGSWLNSNPSKMVYTPSKWFTDSCAIKNYQSVYRSDMTKIPKLDLKNSTFIIPVYIESADRETNTKITLSYLTKYLDTNIIILEHDKVSKVPAILNKLGLQNKVKYIFSHNTAGNDVFHRTRFLNEMLKQVTTPVVINYDVDVLLKPEAYLECQNKVLSGTDLVYPYFWGNSQWQVHYNGRDKLIKTLDLNQLVPVEYSINRSEYGHCQFFSTKSYREGGMENENFISYGPEDKERGLRFKNMGYKVEWLNNIVHHIEHTRGINSSNQNPYAGHNKDLLNKLIVMTKEQLFDYYNNSNYINKYR